MRTKLLSKLMLLLTMMFVGVGSASAADVTDELTADLFTTSSSYTNFSGKQATSNAFYAGQIANNNGSIQIRSKNSDSGIVTTASAGKVKSITVVWDSATEVGRTLDIYGKNSAYSAATDLYDNNKKGTKLGSIVYGTSTSLTVSGDYEFIGLRSNNSAMYITKITIVWDVASTEKSESDFTITSSTDVSIEKTSANPTSTVTYTTSSTGQITWTSDDTSVATVQNGVITAVAMGETTITVSQASDENYKASEIFTINVTVTDASYVYTQPTIVEIVPNYTFWGKDAQFSGSTNDELSGEQDNVTFEWTRGSGSMYANQSSMRFYKDNDLVISAPEGYVITKVELTMSTVKTDFISDPEGYDSESNTWEGSAEAVTLSRPSNADSYAQITKITVTLGTPSAVATPSFSMEGGEYEGAQSIEILCETAGASIYYTLDGTEPTAQSTPYTQAITLSEYAPTTIKAIAVKNGESSAVAVATYTILDPNRPGTESNPYTVAQARAAIDDNVGVTGVYVTGIVSKIVTAYNSQYGNISYNISVDGSENGDQLEAYRGLSFDGENFTSEDDIQVGDQVVIYGNLTKYGSIYELAAGNYLISQVKKTAAPSISGPATFVTEATVTITASEGATIYYTLDGSDPTTNANRLLYTEPFTIEATTTVKAVAVGNNMYSAVVSQTFTQIEVTNGIFELVTDASSLKAGDQILIAYVEDGTAKAMSATQANNNRPAVDVTLIDEITLTPGDDAQVITLEEEEIENEDEDEETSTFLFNVGNGYLYAASSSANHLKTETEPDANGNANATIAIEDGEATILFQGTNTRNLVRYNPNNGSPIFSCYEQKEFPTGKAPMIFRKVVDELPGDVNDDKEVNSEDLEVLVSLILNGGANEACDVNKDGVFGVGDVTALVNILRELNQ